MKSIIFTLMLLPLLAWGQDSIPKSVRDGWAIHLGFGEIYGGSYGVLCERQFLLTDNLRISPFMASGFLDGSDDSLSNRNDYVGISTGIHMEYGKQHRLIFGPAYFIRFLIGDSPVIKHDILHSASFIIGYKGTSHFGLIWQAYIGDIYMLDPESDSNKYFHSTQYGIGVGYKF